MSCLLAETLQQDFQLVLGSSDGRWSCSLGWNSFWPVWSPNEARRAQVRREPPTTRGHTRDLVPVGWNLFIFFLSVSPFNLHLCLPCPAAPPPALLSNVSTSAFKYLIPLLSIPSLWGSGFILLGDHSSSKHLPSNAPGKENSQQ